MHGQSGTPVSSTAQTKKKVQERNEDKTIISKENYPILWGMPLHGVHCTEVLKGWKIQKERK